VALNLVREEGRTAIRQQRRLVLYKAEQPDGFEAPDELMGTRDRRDAVRAALDTWQKGQKILIPMVLKRMMEKMRN
jgi:hypothetical protein